MTASIEHAYNGKGLTLDPYLSLAYHMNHSQLTARQATAVILYPVTLHLMIVWSRPGIRQAPEYLTG